MAQVDFTMEAVWEFVSTQIEADNTGTVEAKRGKDPVTKRDALLLINGASSGVAPHATILLISPSLPDPTKIEAMMAAMKEQTPIAFTLSDVSFYSTVLVLGDDFSDHALAKVQNSDTRVKKVTSSTLPELL